MGKTIGPASDFFRLRVTHLDLTEELEFDWRDDVLWRTPPSEQPEERDIWLVEALTIEGPEVVTRLRAFEDPDDARDFLAEVEEDLAELTKSQFESAWLHGETDAATQTDSL